MKKGYFINCVSMKAQEDLLACGVLKKVNAQIKTLRKSFIVEHDLVNSYKERQSVFDKLKRRLPFGAVDYHWRYLDKYDGSDFLYFRKSDIDYTVYCFLKKFKIKNPKCKIIFEIPTFPYYKENFHGIKDFPMLLKDFINHNKFRKSVDRIVTYSSDEIIWGIPTIVTKNGVDFSTINIPERKHPNNRIDVIEVSSPAYWHGYDRFIEGMGKYYREGGERNIVFHIVGQGAEIEKYRKLTKEYSLEEHIIFYGNKYGKELAEIYTRAHLGIDSLARHRSNNSTNSSLKSREYAAYGLPIISSVPIDFAEDDWKYVMNVAADESPIDMKKVVEFFDAVYNSGKRCNDIAREIREYAETRCDMSITMQQIIDYINE